MTEKEKAQASLLYDANNDQSLIEERLNAAELCYDYNILRLSQQAERDAMLTRILGGKGSNCTIISPFYSDYGYNIEIGDNSTIGAGSIVTKDIPANVLAYGNPCVVIREATDKDR